MTALERARERKPRLTRKALAYLRSTARLRARLRDQAKISPGFLTRTFTR